MATPLDHAFLRATHHDAYQEVTVRQFGSWDVAQQDEFFEACWSLGGLEVIVADGAPCGYCHIETGHEGFHVRELVLAPKFQGRGIGTAFLRRLQEQAQARVMAIRLGTLHHNRALALYGRLGFKELHRTDTHVIMEWSPTHGVLDPQRVD